MESSKVPNRKVVAGGLAGSLTAIMVWLAPNITEVEIPPEIAASITTIVTALVSYFVPNR